MNLPAMQETQVRSLRWKIPWRKERLSTSVFLPGEFHGQRNLAGYSPWVTKSWAPLPCLGKPKDLNTPGRINVTSGGERACLEMP